MNLENNILKLKIHFYFKDLEDHLIRFDVRQQYSASQVLIIQEIISILHPSMDYDIYFLPSENGGYIDNILIEIKENPVIVSLTLISLLLSYSSFHKQDESNIINFYSVAKDNGYDITGIEQEVEIIFNSYGIKKNRNDIYESLLTDPSILKVETEIFDNNNKIISKTIEKSSFPDMISDIPKSKEFLKEDIIGHIELSQPFINKQEQYGRGVAWRGIYYGDDIIDSDTKETIIKDGENVYFYMQDDEYKKQILDKKINFTNGDNLKVIFDIGRSYDYINKKYANPKLYVKRVLLQNENLIEHKKILNFRKIKEKIEKDNPNQATLPM